MKSICFPVFFGVVLVILLKMIVPTFSCAAVSGDENDEFVIDYQDHLNKRFIKVVRTDTRYIIIHTSEAGLSSTLHTLSEGKDVGTYRTVGGHTNYAIARDGQVYRILNHRYRADHSGLSMWNGLEDISSYSVGIELVGYHYDSITPQQYESVSRLLKILQRVYDIPDKNILTHSQVSYGKPNVWFKRPHRGRKRCALNFEREKAGLTDAWCFDPDVKARRLAGDPFINAVFYKKYAKLGRHNKEMIAANKKIEKIQKNGTAKIPDEENISNVISKTNTAWNIAGEDFDNSTTLYVLPDKTAIRGDQLAQVIGLNHIPIGTKVLLNQPPDLEKNLGPVFLITLECTAWSFAGKDYCIPTTIYFLPDGRVIPGDRMPDWDSIPNGTYMIIGYNGPFIIQSKQGKTPWGIAGTVYNLKETVYYIPGKGLITGDQVRDFSNLPTGSQLFLKNTN